MSRLDPAVTRTAIVLSIFLMLFALGLYALYQVPKFEEGTEPKLLVGLLLTAGAALWLGLSGARAMIDVVVTPIRRFGLLAVVVFVVLALTVFMIVARYVLDAFPNSSDEMAYILQAQTYAQGRLWIDVPPLAEAFRQDRFFYVGDKWISQYPPGWAMMLTPAAKLELPLWIVTPFIGTATLLAFFALARRYVSRESAWIGVLALGVSSFFIFNSGSYFSHSLTALYGVVFAFVGLRYIARGEFWCAVAAGACIGLMGLTRTQNAVIFAVPFVVALAMTPGRRMGLLWFGLAGAPFLAALLAYNSAMTGDPLVAVADLHGGEPLGAPSIGSIRLTLRHFERLFIWTSPALLFGYVAAFLTALAWRRVDFTDWIMPGTVIFFLFYAGDGGNQYGPRYYFEGWPFALLTILKVVDPILFGVERGARSAWISSAVITSLLFEVGYLPARFEREHRVVTQRQDTYTQVERAGLTNAIVTIIDNVGIIRPMPPWDLVRNGLLIGEQKVLYVRDLGARNEELRSQFPGRNRYIYSNGRLEAAH